MDGRYSAEDLNNCSKEELVRIVMSMQGKMDILSDDMEKLIEQIRLANQQRFGRHSEKLDVLEGQQSIFDEFDSLYQESHVEPDIEEIVPSLKKKKQSGKRDKDLKDLPVEVVPTHALSNEELDAFYGVGNWKRMPDETYKRVRFEPASYTVELHTIQVAVGTDGLHQDEFLRGKRPRDLFRNSIATPSLVSGFINGKYVNGMPIHRIEQELKRNGVNISKQTISNWTIDAAERYLVPLYDRMQEELLTLHVNQCDETPVQVIKDGRSPGSKSYMWVHRSGEFYKDKQIVLFEYQKGRSHELPLEFYRNYSGILVTDGLSQYHLVDRKLEKLTNANCWAHARRDFADAIKAAGKGDPESIRRSIANQALERIARIYQIEGKLKDLDPKQRLQKRTKEIKPLVEEYFTWLKDIAFSGTVPPKSKTAEGIRYNLNQEQYLKVFLEDGEVPIDNSASERAIRPFCIGKKNWLFCDSIRGAKASAILYSITETAKLNELRPYQYVKYLLEKIPELMDKDDPLPKEEIDILVPWSKTLPEVCYKK